MTTIAAPKMSHSIPITAHFH